MLTNLVDLGGKLQNILINHVHVGLGENVKYSHKSFRIKKIKANYSQRFLEKKSQNIFV